MNTAQINEALSTGAAGEPGVFPRLETQRIRGVTVEDFLLGGG